MGASPAGPKPVQKIPDKKKPSAIGTQIRHNASVSKQATVKASPITPRRGAV